MTGALVPACAYQGGKTRLAGQIADLLMCHNLCRLVQAIYELNLAPTFWPAATAPTSPPQLGMVAP